MSFFDYIQKLELIAFLSGYPLLYAAVNVFAGKQNPKDLIQIVMLLPLSYALVGILYLGFQLRQLYPDYSITHISSHVQQPFWTVWALLSLLFVLPFFRKKPFLSLVHSLPFFFLLCRDLYFHTIDGQRENNVVQNDMKIYTDSLLLQLGALASIILVYFFAKRVLKK